MKKRKKAQRRPALLTMAEVERLMFGMVAAMAHEERKTLEAERAQVMTLAGQTLSRLEHFRDRVLERLDLTEAERETVHAIYEGACS